jgi:hypothetical protein
MRAFKELESLEGKGRTGVLITKILREILQTERDNPIRTNSKTDIKGLMSIPLTRMRVNKSRPKISESLRMKIWSIN